MNGGLLYRVRLYIRVHLKCNDFFGDFLSDNMRGLFKFESGDDVLILILLHIVTLFSTIVFA